MIELPRLIYQETEPQVVPNLNDAKSLETKIPVVLWRGKQVQIKQVWLEYNKMGIDSESIQKMELRLSLIDIISRIQVSHPEYFARCLSE
ncbi:hypothetical protein [Endozoicomonas atrinae]|uniref:hypothetical protein n=1 Tax=Endozoicomonas atrinae TaxID=1333660 RepID=UPI000826E61E|nr:hypothetical protein [Endozoicomonas atrinae]